MTKQQSTATIYQFPRRARPSSGSYRQTVKTTAPKATDYPAAEFGRAWYHEAAVEEDGDARDNRHLQH